MKKTLTVLMMVLLAALLVISCDSSTPPAKTYTVGDNGPAGGYIFYVNPNYEEGSSDTAKNWHYLEAAPADLENKYIFGFYRTGASGSNTTVGTAGGIGTGKSNTAALVKAMGDGAYSESSGTAKASYYAAKACADYGNDTAYDDWFLPSKDELDLMYTNLKEQGMGGTWQSSTSSSYWSSSEKDGNSACTKFFYNGDRKNENRGDNYFVRPIRSF